jgi:hypothetical protein
VKICCEDRNQLMYTVKQTVAILQVIGGHAQQLLYSTQHLIASLPREKCCNRTLKGQVED